MQNELCSQLLLLRPNTEVQVSGLKCFAFFGGRRGGTEGERDRDKERARQQVREESECECELVLLDRPSLDCFVKKQDEDDRRFLWFVLRLPRLTRRAALALDRTNLAIGRVG